MQSQFVLNEALALHQRGQLEQAEALYKSILKANPQNFDALHFFGILAHQTGRYPMAVELLSAAIAINPYSEGPLFNIALTLHTLNRLDEAATYYAKAIALKPDFIQAYYNRGIALKDLKRMDEALASFNQALAYKPDFAEAYVYRGLALAYLRRIDEAITNYDQALALNPNLFEAYYNRGDALRELKRLDEAVVNYAKAFALEADAPFLLGDLLHTKMMICDWQGLDGSLDNMKKDIRSAKRASVPFPVLALLDSPELQKQAAKIYVETRFPPQQHLGPIMRRAKNNKIRLGYYSADFQNHATSYLMAELFEMHDSNKFELFGFSFGGYQQDEMRVRVAAAFDHFFDVSYKSDLDIARQSRELGIDIAIDLKGFTKDSRPGIFAERCAPIQVNYLGYPGTMGADYMDYILADTTLIPREKQANCTEKIVYLPHSYQVNDSHRQISERLFTKADAGLPESGFVFCCFNKNYKILPAAFDVWMRILGAVEGSVLWLLEDNAWAAKNLRKEAELRGVDSNRLVFAQRLPLDEHLARHRLADLFIDSWPYNAHTTASDALWAGLPVLTCLGEAFASRVSASLLRALDLSELIVATPAEFETSAIELALNPQKLAEIKLKLEKNRLATPLFDTQLFTRHIELAYTAMYERYHTGLAPETIEINA